MSGLKIIFTDEVTKKAAKKVESITSMLTVFY